MPQPNALRHTFATRMVDANGPPTTIKDIPGHSSIQTTQIYTQKNIEQERDAISNMTSYLDLTKADKDPPLRGAKARMKFADVNLPDFSAQKTDNAAKTVS